MKTSHKRCRKQTHKKTTHQTIILINAVRCSSRECHLVGETKRLMYLKKKRFKIPDCERSLAISDYKYNKPTFKGGEKRKK